MSGTDGRFEVTVAAARWYFAVQALAGAGWWVAVFAAADVRRWTLGGWDPAWVAPLDLALFVGGSAVAAATGRRIAALVTTAWTTGVAVALAGYGLATHQAGWGVLGMAAATIASAAATSVLWLGALPAHWFFVGPFAFREAPPGAHHLRRSLVQLVVFWSFFFLVVPMVLVAVEDRLRVGWPGLGGEPWPVVGAAAFVLASGLGLWSCLTMAELGEGTPLPAETARRLVVAGPYRYVRNPMAVAGAVQTIGVGLWLGSWLVVTVAVAGAFAWDLVIRPGEEADLAARFGVPYDRYRGQVRCWVPRRRAAGAG